MGRLWLTSAAPDGKIGLKNTICTAFITAQTLVVVSLAENGLGQTWKNRGRRPDGDVVSTSNNGPVRPSLKNQEVLIILLYYSFILREYL